MHTRNDGHAAITVAESLRPEVIVLDIAMPGLDGYETCRLIRKQSWGKDITLVALSGYGQEDDKRLSREAGFDDHLVKPVDLDSITRMLASLPPDNQVGSVADYDPVINE